MDVVARRNGSVAIALAGRISQRSHRRQKTKFFHPMVLHQQLTEGKRPIEDGIQEMYEHILRESPTMFKFFAPENASKNRYPDIPLSDQTRVVLSEGPSDYYHASYVDGLSCPKQYVLAQAPFNKETEADFHRLLAQVKPELVIVLMKEDSEETKLMFPSGSSEKTCSSITIKVDEEAKDKYKSLKVSVGKTHKTNVIFYSTWTDEKFPEDIAFFREFVIKKGGKIKGREGSVLVMCGTGCKRAGVWTLYDSECERLESRRRIRFSESVRQLRCQRLGALDSADLFVGLVDALEKVAKCTDKSKE